MLQLPASWQVLWPFLLGGIVAYLIGSIPFGLLLTKAAGLGDIRKIGSGNIGATNVLRTGRKSLAAATLLLDGGKGTVAALVAFHYGGPDMAVIAAIMAVIGHLFPVWLTFKGGKGVATALGALLGLSWPVGLAACATWLVIAGIFRYSSLASLVSMAMAPVYADYLASRQYAQAALFIALLVWLRHHENIRRLLKREEPKIGAKKKRDTTAS